MSHASVSHRKAVAFLSVSALLIALLLALASAAPADAARPLPPSANIQDALPQRAAPLMVHEAAPSALAAVTLTVDGACADDDSDLVCDSKTDTYKTIQKAIEVATSGAAINVLAGTYTENVIVDKPLTLSGAGADSTTIIPATSGANPDSCAGSLCSGASNIILVQASDVTINGFTLDGNNPAKTSGIVRDGVDLDARNGIITNHSAGVFNDLVVHDVVVKNIYLRGIYASSGGTFNFHHNTVTNVQGDNSSIGIFAWYGPGSIENNIVSHTNDAISANHSRGIVFRNNTITESASGVHTDNSNDGVGEETADVIEGNIVSDCKSDGYGIWVFVPYVAPTVNNNRVTKCAIGLSAWGQGAAVTTSFTNNVVDGGHLTNSLGVYVTTDWINWGYSDVSVTFSGNVIKDNEGGLYFTADKQTWNPGTYVAKTITAVFSNNSITGNAVTADIGTQGTYNLDASGNWWGSNAPATVKAAVNDGVGIDYTPWLDSGTDTSGDAGFQGDFSNLWVDDDSPQTGAVGRVQEGANLVVAGGTVNLAAGTYDTTAATVINKALTLAGPLSGVAKLQGTDGANPSVLEVSASNVTVKNLEVTHSALQPFSSYSSWAELSQCLVCVKNGSSLTGISIKDNVIAVPQQSGSMGTWSGIGLTVGNATTTGITIDGNTIYNTRNGIVVQRNNTATLTNNTIYNTKGGIMNYTGGDADAANRTMTENAWGSAHNEWDVVWNTGVYYTPADRSASVLGVSTANKGAYVIDRRAENAAAEAGLIHNRSHVFVDAASSLNTPHAAKGSQAEPFKTLELGWDAVIEGGTVFVRTGTYTISEGPHPGGLVVTGDGAKINLNGATVGAGSPAFTIVGDDVEINGPGTLDGGGSTSPAILVQAGADDFTLSQVEVRKWASGVQVAGPITSFKMVNNYVWSNGHGLLIDSGAALGGVVTVEGNLFKANTAGITNNNGATLPAQWNSFASTSCPTYTNVDTTNCTFAETFIDVDPAQTGDQFVRNANESQSFDVKLMIDARNLYGFAFKFKFDETKLQKNAVTPSFPAGYACLALTGLNANELGYQCTATTSAAVDSLTPILTVNFTATGSGLTGNGPWDALFDVDHVATVAGTTNGAMVYLNNVKLAGITNPRDITDTDDGKITITGIANFTGFIDVQGRADDSGALLQVFAAHTLAAPVLANATSAKSGAYTTAHLGGNLLTVGTTYYFSVDRPLYVKTAVTVPPSHALTARSFTGLKQLVLKGGDATNDEKVDVSDATLVGGAYGNTGVVCGSGECADVNGDGKVDILDLTLMGGNYGVTASTWTP